MTQGNDKGLRLATATVGCKLNFAETSAMAAQFAGNGYEIVDFHDEADVVLIHTCTVTSHADSDCRKLIRQAVRRSPNAVIIVAGCYSELNPGAIASIEGVDIVLGNEEKFNVLDYLQRYRARDVAEVHCHSLGEAAFRPAATFSHIGGRTRAFLKIQDGCDYKCAYCTIPAARGASRSMDLNEAVESARRLVGSGYREIVLSGVNVGEYGRDTGSSLFDLLDRLTALDGGFRIRISSIEPNLLEDRIIKLMARTTKLCRHIHMPMQSGSAEVLRAMRRRYTKEIYADRVSAVRTEIPDCGIGADVIVGFPGETDEMFQETAAFIQSLPLTYLHVFSYSDRPNAETATWKNKVPPSVIAHRSRVLHLISQEKKNAFAAAQAEKTAAVLFEGRVRNGKRVGLTSNYLEVEVPSEMAGENEMVEIVPSGMIVETGLD
jgi:threonylcarbamoyladenosine tRNA methylthiotransferase MtaB